MLFYMTHNHKKLTVSARTKQNHSASLESMWGKVVIPLVGSSSGNSLCALEDGLGQDRVGLHGGRDQGGEEGQVPDGRGVGHRHLLALGDLVAQRLQAVDARVTAVAQATLDVDLDVWEG